jgi:hypothetical protein
MFKTPASFNRTGLVALMKFRQRVPGCGLTFFAVQFFPREKIKS